MENAPTNTAKFHVQDNSNLDATSLTAAHNNYQKGDYREALNILLGLSNKTMDAEIYLEIGNCYYMLQSQKEAFDYWNKAINLDPKKAKAYTNLGNLYYKNNQGSRAISYWLAALISKPEDAQTLLNLAVAFNEKEMRLESIRYYEKYIKYEENKTNEYFNIKSKIQHCFNVANQYLTYGVEFQSKGDNEKAAACYFKSLATYPNLSKTNLNLGSIFFEDKNLPLAIKYWTSASHLDQNYDKIYSNLAISYDLLKQFDYAYCYYNLYINYVLSDKDEYHKVNSRLLKLKPYLNMHEELFDKHLDLAKDHLSNNRIYEAIDEFKIYSILKPEEGKQYKETIKNLEAYINPEFTIIEQCFEIGNKLINEKNFKEAKPYFYRIMKLSSPRYLEFSKARAKYSQCEKAGV